MQLWDTWMQPLQAESMCIIIGPRAILHWRWRARNSLSALAFVTLPWQTEVEPSLACVQVLVSMHQESTETACTGKLLLPPALWDPCSSLQSCFQSTNFGNFLHLCDQQPGLSLCPCIPLWSTWCPWECPSWNGELMGVLQLLLAIGTLLSSAEIETSLPSSCRQDSPWIRSTGNPICWIPAQFPPLLSLSPDTRHLSTSPRCVPFQRYPVLTPSFMIASP